MFRPLGMVFGKVDAIDSIQLCHGNIYARRFLTRAWAGADAGVSWGVRWVCEGCATGIGVAMLKGLRGEPAPAWSSPLLPKPRLHQFMDHRVPALRGRTSQSAVDEQPASVGQYTELGQNHRMCCSHKGSVCTGRKDTYLEP